MAETYQSLYKNERRAVQIEIDDQYGNGFSPSAAYTSVEDKNGNVIIPEQVALVAGNVIRTLIGTSVTSTVGEYRLIWKILQGNYIYYHLTIIEVQEL